MRNTLKSQKLLTQHSVKKGSYRGVVFDKDGTLIDFDCFWFGIVRHASQAVIEEYSIAESHAELAFLELAGFNRSGQSSSYSLIRTATNTGIADMWRRKLLTWGYVPQANFVHKYTGLLSNNSHYGIVKPLANLPPIFHEIKRRGLFIGVVTSDNLRQTKYCLDSIGVLNITDMILAADSGSPPKPAPDLLYKMASIWHVSVSDLIMIGDTESDMLFAKNAGAQAIMISKDGHGYADEYECISSVADVLRYL